MRHLLQLAWILLTGNSWILVRTFRTWTKQVRWGMAALMLSSTCKTMRILASVAVSVTVSVTVSGVVSGVASGAVLVAVLATSPLGETWEATCRPQGRKAVTAAISESTMGLTR